MNYLIYIEHSAENLQFFLWYKDYVRRFDLLSAGERRLAPEWSLEQADAQALALKDNPAPMKSISADTAAVFRGTDFATPKANIADLSKGGPNPFGTPPMTPKSGDHDSIAPSEYPWSDSGSTLRSGFRATHDQKAAGAFEAADVKLQPCMSTPQPSFHSPAIF